MITIEKRDFHPLFILGIISQQPQAAEDANCGGAWEATLCFEDIRSVAWGAGLYVAVGADAILTSPDGVTWTQHALGGASFRDVAWGGTQRSRMR